MKAWCVPLLSLLAACAAPADKHGHTGPQPCTDEWFGLVESRVPTGDGHGHGPDPGSQEWKSVVEFHLGLRDNPDVPDTNTPQWCTYVDAYLGELPFDR